MQNQTNNIEKRIVVFMITKENTKIKSISKFSEEKMYLEVNSGQIFN